MRALYAAVLVFALSFSVLPARAQTQPSPSDQSAAAARTALQQHHQAQAVALLERALSQDPSRKAALVNDLIEARLAYAGSLWDGGAYAAAAVQYRLVLQDDPVNAEASRDLARLASIDARQHEAKRLATSYLAAHQGDVETLLTRAQAEYWMGRPDSAKRDVDRALARDPKNGDALSLQSDIRNAAAAQFRTRFDVAKQSDDIVVQESHFEAETYLNSGRSSVGAYVDHYRYTAENETGELLVDRPAVFVHHRLNDWVDLAAEVSNDRISSPDDSSVNASVATYDVDLSLWTSDTHRFDIRSQRQTLGNVVSLGEAIAQNLNSVSLEVRPDLKTRAWFSLGRAAYSDGNRASFEQAEYERQMNWRPRVYVGASAYAANYGQQLFDGYFSPFSYRAFELTARLESSRDRLWGYDVRGSFGHEWIGSAAGDVASVLGANVRYRLSNAAELEFFYEVDNTRQASNSGSFRHFGGIALRQRI